MKEEVTAAARPIVNCEDRGWGFKLVSNLMKHQDVDLINVDLSVNEILLDECGKRFGMNLEREHDNRTVHFRRSIVV
jgi:hypothetical protein